MNNKEIHEYMMDQPILVKGSAVGIDKDIVIFAGKDIREMIQQLKDFGLTLPSIVEIGKGVER